MELRFPYSRLVNSAAPNSVAHNATQTGGRISPDRGIIKTIRVRGFIGQKQKGANLARHIDPEAKQVYEKVISESQSTLPKHLADQSGAFEVAAQAADAGGSAAASQGASSRGGGRNVTEWAREKGLIIPRAKLDSLTPAADTTSEHTVFYRQVDDRAVKETKEGYYGQIPAAEDGRLSGRDATPAEYLRRMKLQAAVFHSDLRLEGVTIPHDSLLEHPEEFPRFVISQPWYEKSGPITKTAVKEYLSQEGFVQVPNSFNGWVRLQDGVVIVDASPDNFVMTKAGLVPIDLQMTVFTPSQLKEAGLTGLK